MRRVLAWAVCLVGIATILAGLYLNVRALAVRSPPPYWLLVIYVVMGAVATLFGGGLVQYARRLAAHSAEALTKKDKRPPVLLLRSFADDESLDTTSQINHMGLLLPSNRIEYVVANSLRRIGPVVAIGDPREELPRDGAARYYVRGSDWKEVADSLIDDAKFVVFLVGTQSAGFQWEMRRARSRKPPGHVAIVFPQSEETLAITYERSWPVLSRAFGVKFPNRGGRMSRVILFDQHWSPSFTSLAVRDEAVLGLGLARSQPYQGLLSHNLTLALPEIERRLLDNEKNAGPLAQLDDDDPTDTSAYGRWIGKVTVNGIARQQIWEIAGDGKFEAIHDGFVERGAWDSALGTISIVYPWGTVLRGDIKGEVFSGEICNSAGAGGTFLMNKTRES